MPPVPDNQPSFEQIPDNSTVPPVDVPVDPTDIVSAINPLLDDGPASIAPFSVPPPSVPPPSVPPALVCGYMK